MLKMVQHNHYSGRLYLAKGDERIYVDVRQLLQPQIEGIRFLYKQFNKKKSGVILNDPTSSGKTHQVVVFLNAIKSLLNKPILILCSGHEKNHWFTHFNKLTDFGNGVTIEPLDRSAKGMSVCIDTKSNLTSLVTCDWSVVVVDDDSAINLVLKKVFKANYKIWITSVDMKTNLEAFCKIFGWLCPQEKDRQKVLKENVQKITTDRMYTEYSIDELILLDAMMEDVVLRRKNGFSPFQTQNKISSVEIKISSKNKDISGTKTKRSKQRITAETSFTQNTLNLNSKFDNNEKRDEETNNDENKDESVTNNQDILLQLTEPAKYYEPKGPDGLDIVYKSKDDHNKDNFNNDALHDAKDMQPEDDETSKTKTELDILNDSILKSSNLNVSGSYEETTEIEMVDVSEQPQRNSNVKCKTKLSPYKSIDDVIRETEEIAMKKFKGSLLDNIFEGK